MGSVNANARSMKLRTILCQAAPWARRTLWHWWINWASILLSHEHFGFYMKQMSPLCQNEQSKNCWCFQQLSVKSSHQTNPPWYPTVAILLKACWTTWCWSASTGPRGSPAELQGGGLTWSHPSALCSTVWANHNVTTAVSPSTERCAL